VTLFDSFLYKENDSNKNSFILFVIII